jgi:putative sterol carrier protein
MSLEVITQGLKDSVGEDCGLDATLKFNFIDSGVLYLDATQTPNIVCNDDKAAQCTLKISMSNFIELSQGRLNAIAAVMTRRLEIDGDINIAKRMHSIF